jgi:DNA-binding transcriptional LysR family regulator
MQYAYIDADCIQNGSNGMDKLEAMSAFTRVVASGSYAEAGRTLGLTRSAVSKAVMELEQLLGARLLDRTTRRVSPTEAGLAYYERCVDIIAQVEETEMQVSSLHDEPKGVLKINAPTSFGTLYLGPLVAEFLASYSELKIEMTLNDRFIDPIEEGVDVTIRIAVLSDSSLIARKLAPAPRVLVASNDYLKKFGLPQNVDDLERHRCLNYGHTTTLQRWQLTAGGETINVPINSAFCANNGEILRWAALAGHGIALLPTFIVGSDLREGKLVQVLTDNPPIKLDIYALYAPNKYLAAKTRVFIDFLVRRFGETPDLVAR